MCECVIPLIIGSYAKNLLPISAGPVTHQPHLVLQLIHINPALLVPLHAGRAEAAEHTAQAIGK